MATVSERPAPLREKALRFSIKSSLVSFLSGVLIGFAMVSFVPYDWAIYVAVLVLSVGVLFAIAAIFIVAAPKAADEGLIRLVKLM